MARVSTFLLFVSTLFCATCSLAQEKIAPAHAIGKRVEISVKYKNEDGDFKCVGTVAQVDQEKLILEDVSKTENTNRGVPFLSNLKHQEKLFKNVGAIKTIKLEFDIVVPLDRIKSCQIAELKDVENGPEEADGHGDPVAVELEANALTTTIWVLDENELLRNDGTKTFRQILQQRRAKINQ